MTTTFVDMEGVVVDVMTMANMAMVMEATMVAMAMEAVGLETMAIVPSRVMRLYMRLHYTRP